MKKIKVKIFYISVLFVLAFFNAQQNKTHAATPEELCKQSGGSGLSMLGNCNDCPSGKFSSNGVCVLNDNGLTGTPSDYDPNAGTASQGQNLFGRGSETTTNTAGKPLTFSYRLLETFPGFFGRGQVLTDLPALIVALYKFGVWTVGLAATFMLVIGGFMYMTSAGNTSRSGSAKGVIWDSLIGLVVALSAYLLLYVINPDLVKPNFNLVSVEIKALPSPSASRDCKPVSDSSSFCSVGNLKDFFNNNIRDNSIDVDKWAEQASSICNAESGGRYDATSYGKCNGASIAIGLFQYNINTGTGTSYARCPGAFDAVWRSKYGMANGGCTAIDAAKYQNCKNNAMEPLQNLKYMWSLYKNRGYSWNDWEVNTNGTCNFAARSAMK